MSAPMRVLVALALVAGCSKGGTEPASPTPAKQVAPDAPIALGARPHLVGVLEGLELGAPIAAVRARGELLTPEQALEREMPGAAAAAAAGTQLEVAPPPPPPPGAGKRIELARESWVILTPRATYELGFLAGKLDTAAIRIKGMSAAQVRAAWPIAARTGDQSLVFLDPARRVRAQIAGYSQDDPVEIILRPYVPLASLVDRDPTRFAGHAILGRPLADVAAELAPLTRGQDSAAALFLPVTEFAYEETSLSLRFDATTQRVTGYEFGSPLFQPTDAMVGDVLALYAKLWGPSHDIDEVTVGFGKAPEVRVDVRYGSVHVRAE